MQLSSLSRLGITPDSKPLNRMNVPVRLKHLFFSDKAPGSRRNHYWLWRNFPEALAGSC